MDTENKEEKIKFLENILRVAEANPKAITDKGMGILYEDYSAFEEDFTIGVHLDEKGKAYFKVFGTHILSNHGNMYNPELLLNAGEDYLIRPLDEFKKKFHLYETKEGGLDLLDKIR